MNVSSYKEIGDITQCTKGADDLELRLKTTLYLILKHINSSHRSEFEFRFFDNILWVVEKNK